MAIPSFEMIQMNLLRGVCVHVDRTVLCLWTVQRRVWDLLICERGGCMHKYVSNMAIRSNSYGRACNVLYIFESRALRLLST